MKHLLLALLLSLPAITNEARASDAPAAQAEVAAQETTVINPDATALPKAAAAARTRCIRDTGTRIKRRDDRACNGLPGRSYDRDDLDSTGAIDTTDALRRLDPAIGR